MKKNKDKFSFNYFFVSLLIFLTAVCTTFFIPNYFKILSWADYLNSTMVTELASDSETGSSSNPYIIKTAEQLASFAQSVNSGTTYLNRYIELGNNIDISSYTWVPIGSSNTRCFRGHFNGNGHAVIGLKYSSTSTSSFGGLFGYLYSADVSNVTIVNGSVSAYYAGALSGYAYEANIANCITISTTVSGIRYCGGIVGRAYDSTISQCKNNASVTCSRTGTTGDGYAGGIVGYFNSNSEVSLCYNTGDIVAQQESYDNDQNLYAGGIAGACPNDDTSTIRECYNEGDVKAGSSSSTSQAMAGGITGYGGEISYCGNRGDIEAYSEVTVSQSAVYDDPVHVGLSDAGSEIYYVFQQYFPFENASDLVNVRYTYSERAYSGGITGYSNENIISCYNIGDVVGGEVREECELVFIIFMLLTMYHDLESIPTWWGWFDAYRVEYEYVSTYRYSPINGNVKSYVSNCYGNGSYVSAPTGYTSYYQDMKEQRNPTSSNPLTYEYRNNRTWGNRNSFSGRTNRILQISDALLEDYAVLESGSGYLNFKVHARFKAGKNDYVNVDQTLYSRSFDNSVNYNLRTDSQMKNLVNNGLNSTYWAANSLINDGYPVPKNIFWNYGAESF